jgi:hypothetical protein
LLAASWEIPFKVLSTDGFWEVYMEIVPWYEIDGLLAKTSRWMLPESREVASKVPTIDRITTVRMEIARGHSSKGLPV